METKLPKNYISRLQVLDKDLQEKVKRAVDKEKTLKKCEVVASERNKDEFLKQHFKIIGLLPKHEYNRIFVNEKWNDDINFTIIRLNQIKNIVKESSENKERKKEVKKIDSALVAVSKPPLKIKINKEVIQVNFFIFKKTDSPELTEKKWNVIKSMSTSLKGDIVRTQRLLNFFDIPINEEKRKGRRYVFGVKNLNLKKRRIYIATKSDFEFAMGQTTLK